MHSHPVEETTTDKRRNMRYNKLVSDSGSNMIGT